MGLSNSLKKSKSWTAWPFKEGLSIFMLCTSKFKQTYFWQHKILSTKELAQSKTWEHQSTWDKYNTLKPYCYQRFIFCHRKNDNQLVFTFFHLIGLYIDHIIWKQKNVEDCKFLLLFVSLIWHQTIDPKTVVFGIEKKRRCFCSRKWDAESEKKYLNPHTLWFTSEPHFRELFFDKIILDPEKM